MKEITMPAINRTGHLCLALLFSISCNSTIMADKNTALPFQLGEPTNVIAQLTFDQPLDKAFVPVKGEWKIVDSCVAGKELAADNHAAVLTYQQKNRNSIVRFSFRIDGTTTGFHFSLNHAGGHLFRVIVAPQTVTISLDKDKKDATSRARVLAKTTGNFEQGRWYTMQVEMMGDHIFVQTDNGLTVKASHPTLNTDKPNYRFVMKCETLSIDDLQIWQLV